MSYIICLLPVCDAIQEQLNTQGVIRQKKKSFTFQLKATRPCFTSLQTQFFLRYKRTTEEALDWVLYELFLLLPYCYKAFLQVCVYFQENCGVNKYTHVLCTFSRETKIYLVVQQFQLKKRCGGMGKGRKKSSRARFKTLGAFQSLLLLGILCKYTPTANIVSWDIFFVNMCIVVATGSVYPNPGNPTVCN